MDLEFRFTVFIVKKFSHKRITNLNGRIEIYALYGEKYINPNLENRKRIWSAEKYGRIVKTEFYKDYGEKIFLENKNKYYG